jgi:hypothetical protein
MTRQDREAEAQRAREAEEATEAGDEYFHRHPEAMLAEAIGEATRRYGVNSNQWRAFYDAVRAARRRRDAYLQEAGQ